VRPAPRSARGDRAALAALGLGLLAAGGYGLARSYGAFGARRADSVVLTGKVRAVAHHAFSVSNRDVEWFWPAVAAALVLVAYLGYRWLRSQLPPSHRAQVLDLTDPALAAEGSTVVRAVGAESAVVADVESYPEVQAADARVTQDGGGAALRLRLEVDESADVGAVRRRLGEHAVARLGQALDRSAVATSVQVRLRPPAGRHLA
jgi:hypothetical protein